MSLLCRLAKVRRRGAVDLSRVSKSSFEQLDLVFGSEFPTERAPERAALVARIATIQARKEEQEAWFDSEAPTGVAAERPLLPRPPRSPTL